MRMERKKTNSEESLEINKSDNLMNNDRDSITFNYLYSLFN